MPGQETKDRILDTAERLFAEKGFDATSLRAITTAADVNLAAVNYHFGSKETLLSAVFERRLGPVNAERLTMLDALEAEHQDRPLSPEKILRAFLLPPFRKSREWGARGASFMQLAGRMHSEANPALRRRFIDQFAEVLARFAAALARALPDLGREDLHWRLHFVVGAMAHTLIWKRAEDCVAEADHRGLHPDDVLELLVRFALAGLRAPALQPERS